ncbi:MAG: VWA domain-containing protein [Gammaproteobacteria bacterium]
MTFAHPIWLLAAVLAAGAMLWTWWCFDRRQRAALAQFVAAHLQTKLTQSVSTVRQRVKRGLLAATVVLLFIALAGPQAGFQLELIKRRGNDIIFAVDTSRSMMTPDVKPNRLARAKLAIDDFVGHLDGDAVGLIAFAGSAFLQTPITLDYGAFRENLAVLDTHIIPRGGTNITSAVRQAQAALRSRPDSDKVLILVTDGEDLEGDVIGAAKAAAQQGLKIYTVGVGTANGDLIPLPADQGGGFLKDTAGQFVKSHLDEATLRHIAEVTGGIYTPLGSEGQGLETIYRQALGALAKHDLAAEEHRVYIQRFQWPLGAGLLCLITSLLISTRRRRTASASLPAAASSPARESGGFLSPASTLIPALLCLLLFHSAQASPSSAEKAYRHGDFLAAERDYAAAAAGAPQQPLMQYNAGAAAYKAGEYPRATQAFQEALRGPSGDAKRLAQQEDAYFNLGDSLYRTGQKTEVTSPDATLGHWTQAVKAYDSALQLHSDDVDAKFNRDLVNRKIEALKKKQAQQPQPKSGDNKSQDQQKQPHNDANAQQQPQPSGPQSKQSGSQPPQSAHSQQPSPGQPGQAPKRKEADKNSPAGGPRPGSQASQGLQEDSGNPPSSQPSSAAGPAPRQAETGREPGRNAQSADNQRLPGQMSREEARELLNSMKSDERRLPAQPLARNDAQNIQPDQPQKDW